MKEIAPGIYQWTTFHEGIQSRVSSCYLASGDGVLLDPRVPDEGMDWFRDRPPQDALLTNRLHYRHAGRFARAFGTRVHVHRAGLHEFKRGQVVEPFEFGAKLPGGVRAVEIATLCDEETALFCPALSAIALGDAVVRSSFRGPLSFVDDELIGEEPERVKRGLREALARLLDLEWDHLLLAHGAPVVSQGKRALENFLAGRALRRAA
jgi:hypothetical protein